jgi:hypothetical protein
MKKFKDSIEKQVRHNIIERYVNPHNKTDDHISLKEDNSPIVEILPAIAGAAAGFIARKAAKAVVGKAAGSLAPAVAGGVAAGVANAATKKALDKKKEKKVDEGLYSIKNTKTGQRYSVSKYQDDKKLDKIRKGGGDHKHAAHYKDGKPLEESQDLQAKMALDDAGIPWTMKRNRITVKRKDKKKAQLAWEKSFKKGGWPSLNIEEVEDEGYVGTKKKKEMIKKHGYPNQHPKKDKYSGYVEDTELISAFKEAFFKVSIPDIAPTFVEAGSASQVKMNLRKILRPDSMKELEVEKVTPTIMKKMYRNMAKGEGETNEKLSSSSFAAGIRPAYKDTQSISKKKDEKKK